MKKLFSEMKFFQIIFPLWLLQTKKFMIEFPSFWIAYYSGYGCWCEVENKNE